MWLFRLSANRQNIPNVCSFPPEKKSSLIADEYELFARPHFDTGEDTAYLIGRKFEFPSVREGNPYMLGWSSVADDYPDSGAI